MFHHVRPGIIYFNSLSVSQLSIQFMIALRNHYLYHDHTANSFYLLDQVNS